MARILVVDDESGIRELLSEILCDEGFDVTVAKNAEEARRARADMRPDLVLLDIWMPDTDGITLLKEWSANGELTMPVIMMSGHGTIDTALEATRIGALDFLEKPIGMQKLLSAVKKGMESRKHTDSGLSLAAFPRSPALRDLKKRLEQIALRTSVILLRTPAGGLVEIAARTLQFPGKSWIDLAASSQPLSLEVLQAAGGGLLYCEELARLSRIQQKNLKFALERLGQFNLKMVVGTAQEMSQLLALGFEDATLRRLFDVWVGLPSLAQIKDEIPDIAGHVLQHLADSGDIAARHLSIGAQNVLRQYAWPEGYGQLRNALRALALGALQETISEEDVRRHLSPGAMTDSTGIPGLPAGVMELPLREARENFERLYLQYHLAREGGAITRLAERSGLERTHLYRKLKDLGIRIGKE